MISDQTLFPTRDGKDFVFLGYPMHLTPTENRVLHYLWEMQGSAVKARELCTRCYGAGGADATNVSVRINGINQKAIRIGGRRLLHHQRGRGYTFCDDV